MKLCKYSLILLLLISACKGRDDVSTESRDVTLITDSIFTRLPGTLVSTNNYVVWTDPFATFFLHIISINDGKEIAKGVVIGQGPFEFNSPKIFPMSDDNVVVYDTNLLKETHLNLDNFTRVEEISNMPQKTRLATSAAMFNDELTLRLYPSDTNQIHLEDSTGSAISEISIREIDIDGIESFYSYQGDLLYNSNNNSIVYASRFSPYISIYHLGENNSVEKVYEFNQIKEDMQRSTLSPAIWGMTLTKDYIVVQMQDCNGTQDNKPNSPPTRLYIFNYLGEIERIIELNEPILRVSGRMTDNRIFAILSSDNYKLVYLDV